MPWALNTPVLANYIGSTASCTAASVCTVGGVTPHLEYPMVLNWNFGVQHAITNNLTLDVSYVGNKGQHLFDYTDLNQPSPAYISGQRRDHFSWGQSATENALRPYQTISLFSMALMGSIGNISNYNALQVTATQRAYHGLTFLATYTFSHALDDNSSDLSMLRPQNSLIRRGVWEQLLRYSPSLYIWTFLFDSR